MSAPDLSFDLDLPQGAAPGRFRFLGMTGHEALGRLFEFRIRFVSDKPAIDPLKVLGEKVRLSMQTADGQRHFHGHAAAFEYLGPIDLPLAAEAANVAQYHYAVVARPWLWFLTRSTDCRVFQNLKVPEICDQILGKYTGKVTKKLDGDYQPWEYCVQYRESDFNFVSRLMEQEGIFYFFEHEKGDHALKLVDLHGPSTPVKHKLAYVPGQRTARLEQECIDGWTAQHEVQPGAYAIKEYDFKKPTAPQLSVVRRPYEHGQGRLEIYDYPGAFDALSEGDGYVRVRLEEMRTRHETVRASCNVRGIAAGDVFELTNPEQAGAAAKAKYLVTEAAFELSAGLEPQAQGAHYSCVFSCIRASEQFRPLRSTPRAVMQGPQTATVVGPGGEEIHTDNYGRIKVHFHWDRHSKDDKESSCWVRVSHPWAGRNFGMVAIPRIGQEVVVDFLEGDPDRPLVTGRVYNQDNMPPYALPANKTQSGILTRSSLGGSAANANSLRFEDKKGSEQVYLHAEKNQDIEVENDETHWVGHDRTKTIDHDETTHVKHDRTETVDNNEKITIGVDRTEKVGSNEKIDIGVNRTETVGSNEDITIGANRTEKVGVNETITIGSNRSVTVGASETKMVALQRTHTVGVNETIAIGAAQEVAIGAYQMVNVGANQDVNVGVNQSTSVGVNRSVDVGSKLSTSVGADESRKVTGGRSSDVGKDDALKVGKNLVIDAGDSVTIKTGSASISMKKDGTIVIKGKDITIEGSGKINVKASSDIVMKGSKILQN